MFDYFIKCILLLEIIASHTFSCFHYAPSSLRFTPNEDGAESKVLGIGRGENTSERVEELRLIIKLLYH